MTNEADDIDWLWEGTAGGVEKVALSFLHPDGSAMQTRVRAVSQHDEDGVSALHIVIEAESADAYEKELLHALQQTLIPATPPTMQGLDVAAAYQPGQGEVGGDFYDVFEVANADWCVVLGDVSGKGTDAAIVTAAARHAVRSCALREPTPSGLLGALNRALIDHASTRFCTVALARVQCIEASWVATLASAGHPFPLLIRHGAVTKLGRPGSLVGVFDDVAFHDVSIKLATGDALVLFTDGVLEARDDNGEFFGDDRLSRAVAGAGPSAQAIVDAVMHDVLAFQQQRHGDDIALVVIRRP